jgi:hypothetical protein
VKVRRSVETGSVLGYVLDVGPDFFLVLVVGDDIHYDGFQAFRQQDVTSVDVPHRSHDFVERALRLRREPRPNRPRIELKTLPLLLRSVARQFPLVTIHRERREPDVCWIGRAVSVSEHYVELLQITTNARWEGEPTKHRLSEITRVDVGCRYEDALYQVSQADPRRRVAAR